MPPSSPGGPAAGVQCEQQHRVGEGQYVGDFLLPQRPGAVPVHVKDPDEGVPSWEARALIAAHTRSLPGWSTTPLP